MKVCYVPGCGRQAAIPSNLPSYVEELGIKIDYPCQAHREKMGEPSANHRSTNRIAIMGEIGGYNWLEVMKTSA